MDLDRSLRQLGSGALGAWWNWCHRWWQVVFVGSQIAVLALAPSSYRHGTGGNVLRQLYLATGPGLPGFTLLMALFNVVVIRVVVVTAFSYGLSQFAVETVVRVLVLELIPLMAALFVALYYSVPAGSDLYDQRRAGVLPGLRDIGVEALARNVLPRVLAGFFAVILLAVLSGVISVVLTYPAIHGFALAGLTSYNRAVGQVFDPSVTLIFGLKTLLFALAVGLLPLANALRGRAHQPARTRVVLQSLVQVLMVMLLIEMLSLVGNYY